MISFRLRQWGLESWALVRIESDSELFEEELLAEAVEGVLGKCDGHLQRSDEGSLWENVE